MPRKNQHILNEKQHSFTLINLLMLYFYALIDPGKHSILHFQRAI